VPKGVPGLRHHLFDLRQRSHDGHKRNGTCVAICAS
jgi:hypothetical protein